VSAGLGAGVLIGAGRGAGAGATTMIGSGMGARATGTSANAMRGGAGAGAGAGEETVFETTAAVTAAAAATGTTTSATLSSTSTGAWADDGGTSGVDPGRTDSIADFTLSGTGSLSIMSLGMRMDLSFPIGSLPMAFLIESGSGTRLMTFTRKVLIVLVGAFIKTMTAPRTPTIPTASPPRMVPVFEEAATAAAAPAAVAFSDAEAVEVGVGNAVNIKRGLDVAEKLNGLGEKVPVKLIVPNAVIDADHD